MKHLGFLLKMSVMTLVASMLSTTGFSTDRGPFSHTNARRSMNANDENEYQTPDLGGIIDLAVNRTIKASDAGWANKAISLEGNEYTGSVDTLKKAIQTYYKDKFQGEKIALLNHKKRMLDEGDYIESILAGEDEATASVNYKEWIKTESGSAVLSNINGTMVCIALHLRNKKYESTDDWENYVWATGKYKNHGLYDDVFAALISCLKGKLNLETNRLMARSDKPLEKILRHFGDPATTNEQEPEKEFKNYLKHDFYCYLKQIGIITETDIENGGTQSALDLISDTVAAHEEVDKLVKHDAYINSNLISDTVAAHEEVDELVKFDAPINNFPKNADTLAKKMVNLHKQRDFLDFFEQVNDIFRKHNLLTFDLTTDEKVLNRNLCDISYLKTVEAYLSIKEYDWKLMQRFLTFFENGVNMIAGNDFLKKNTRLTEESCAKALCFLFEQFNRYYVSLSSDKVLEVFEPIINSLSDAKILKDVDETVKWVEHIVDEAMKSGVEGIRLDDAFFLALLGKVKNIPIGKIIDEIKSCKCTDEICCFDSVSRKIVSDIVMGQLNNFPGDENDKDNKNPSGENNSSFRAPGDDVNSENKKPKSSTVKEYKSSSRNDASEVDYPTFKALCGSKKLPESTYCDLFKRLSPIIKSMMNNNEIQLSNKAKREYDEDSRKVLDKITFGVICRQYEVNKSNIEYFKKEYLSQYSITGLLGQESIKKIFNEIDPPKTLKQKKVIEQPKKLTIKLDKIDGLYQSLKPTPGDKGIARGRYDSFNTYCPNCNINQEYFTKMFIIFMKKILEIGKTDKSWYKIHSAVYDENINDNVTLGFLCYIFGTREEGTPGSGTHGNIDVDYGKLENNKEIKPILNQIFG